MPPMPHAPTLGDLATPVRAVLNCPAGRKATPVVVRHDDGRLGIAPAEHLSRRRESLAQPDVRSSRPPLETLLRAA